MQVKKLQKMKLVIKLISIVNIIVYKYKLYNTHISRYKTILWNQLL